MTHRELCFDLAAAKATPYIEVPLEGVWYNINYGKADVLTIKPSYTKFNLDIYECKVSKSDFNNEIKTEKYKKYLKYCHRLYFACLSGIAKKSEIPEGIGLIVRGDNGWSTIKQAKKNNIDIPRETLMSILFYKGRIYSPRRKNMALFSNPYHTTDKEKLKGYGRSIKKKILDYNNIQLKFSNLLYYASKNLFKSEEERENFIIMWENKNYTGSYYR